MRSSIDNLVCGILGIVVGVLLTAIIMQHEPPAHKELSDLEVGEEYHRCEGGSLRIYGTKHSDEFILSSDARLPIVFTIGKNRQVIDLTN